MSTKKSIKNTARIISILGTVSSGLLMAGCSDDAIENAVTGISEAFAVPQTETGTDNENNVVNNPPQTSQPPVTETEAPVISDPEPPTFVDAEPPANVDPEPPIFADPEPLVQEPPTFQQPPEMTNVSGTGSDTFLALQRLQPGTLWDYTVTADGATFSAFIDFSNSELIDEGEDSLLSVGFDDGGFLFCGFAEGSYICIDVFPEGNAFLDLFTLDANNTGRGIFSVCADLVADVDDCLNTLLESPAGTSVITAGQQVAFSSSALASSHTDTGSEYIQHLAQQEPVISNRSNEGFSELTQKLINLIELSITQ